MPTMMLNPPPLYMFFLYDLPATDIPPQNNTGQIKVVRETYSNREYITSLVCNCYLPFFIQPNQQPLEPPTTVVTPLQLEPPTWIVSEDEFDIPIRRNSYSSSSSPL